AASTPAMRLCANVREDLAFDAKQDIVAFSLNNVRMMDLLITTESAQQHRYAQSPRGIGNHDARFSMLAYLGKGAALQIRRASAGPVGSSGYNLTPNSRALSAPVHRRHQLGPQHLG